MNLSISNYKTSVLIKLSEYFKIYIYGYSQIDKTLKVFSKEVIIFPNCIFKENIILDGKETKIYDFCELKNSTINDSEIYSKCCIENSSIINSGILGNANINDSKIFRSQIGKYNNVNASVIEESFLSHCISLKESKLLNSNVGNNSILIKNIIQNSEIHKLCWITLSDIFSSTISIETFIEKSTIDICNIGIKNVINKESFLRDVSTESLVSIGEQCSLDNCRIPYHSKLNNYVKLTLDKNFLIFECDGLNVHQLNEDTVKINSTTFNIFEVPKDTIYNFLINNYENSYLKISFLNKILDLIYERKKYATPETKYTQYQYRNYNTSS